MDFLSNADSYWPDVFPREPIPEQMPNDLIQQHVSRKAGFVIVLNVKTTHFTIARNRDLSMRDFCWKDGVLYFQADARRRHSACGKKDRNLDLDLDFLVVKLYLCFFGGGVRPAARGFWDLSPIVLRLLLTCVHIEAPKNGDLNVIWAMKICRIYRVPPVRHNPKIGENQKWKFSFAKKFVTL